MLYFLFKRVFVLSSMIWFESSGLETVELLEIKRLMENYKGSSTGIEEKVLGKLISKIEVLEMNRW